MIDLDAVRKDLVDLERPIGHSSRALWDATQRLTQAIGLARVLLAYLAELDSREAIRVYYEGDAK